VVERYAQTLTAHGNTLMLVSVNSAAYEQLQDTGCLLVLGDEKVFVADQSGATTMQAFPKAQQLIQMSA
jgi:hypothetical protein